METENLITSVIGFDFNITILDENDQPIKIGIKSTINCSSGEVREVSNIIRDKKWFTHFNEALYNKVLDFRKNNE